MNKIIPKLYLKFLFLLVHTHIYSTPVLLELTFFPAAMIYVDPSNASIEAGQWVMFSCSIFCSHRQLITWFVNGSTLSLAEAYGFVFKSDPPHSYCSDMEGFNSTLSLKLDRPIDNKINIHCAVVSLCDLDSTANCTTTSCYSGGAYLEGISV